MKYCLSCGLQRHCDKRTMFDHYSHDDCWVPGDNKSPAINMSGAVCGEEAVCPYCGEVVSDSWEMTPDTSTHECRSCGREFHYRRIVEITYETKKV